MFGELGTLAWTGMKANYNSWGSADSMDLNAAVEFEDAMRIGSSNTGGFGGGLNNLLLQSGYTFGIIGTIALEELAMWGATAALGLATPATGGASGAAAVATGTAAAARTGYNIAKLAKLGRRIADSFDVTRMLRGTRSMMKNMNKADNARGWFNGVRTGGKVIGNFVAPETMAAFKALKSSQKAGDNLTSMAKISKGLGGFYRDLRSLNFALSEGRMEAGSVYMDVLNRSMSQMKDKNLAEGLSENLTDAQIAIADARAQEAAFATTSWNAPLIYLSNQLLLGNSMGGFKRTLNQAMRDNIDGVGRRILKTRAAVKTGKDGTKTIAKDVFEDVGESFMNYKYLYKSVKAGGIRGGASMAAGAALRFFAANVGEGLQEVYQEAVAKGVGDYYTALATDPMAGGSELFQTSALAGLSEQFSAQGLHTFMSGFLMGGVVAGPQKLVFQGMPMLYQKTFNKKEYAEYKANKEKLVKDLVDTYNSAWNSQADDVQNMFDSTKLNFLSQKQEASAMVEAQLEDSMFNFIILKEL